MSKIMWIDQEVFNAENKGYAKTLDELGYKNKKTISKSLRCYCRYEENSICGNKNNGKRKIIQ